MPEKWTCELIGRMHNNKVTYEDLAKCLGVTKAYVSMVLNGARTYASINDETVKAEVKDLAKADVASGEITAEQYKVLIKEDYKA